MSIKLTNRVEQAILNHPKLREKVIQIIQRISGEATAVEEVKQVFTDFLMRNVATVVLDDDGKTAKFVVADAFVQNLIRDALEEVNWAGLMQKYRERIEDLVMSSLEVEE